MNDNNFDPSLDDVLGLIFVCAAMLMLCLFSILFR